MNTETEFIIMLFMSEQFKNLQRINTTDGDL